RPLKPTGRNLAVNRTRVLCLALLVLLVVRSSHGAEQWVRFTSQDEKFSVAYPGSWRKLSGTSVLDIVNFPESEQSRGLIVPQMGARITALRAPKEIRSVEQWIRAIQNPSTHPVGRPSELNLSGKHVTGAIEFQWRSEVGAETELYETALFVSSD